MATQKRKRATCCELHCLLCTVLVLLSAKGPAAASAAVTAAPNTLLAGDKAYADGDYTAAVSFYTQGISMEPFTPLLYTQRAVAYVKLGSYAEALEDRANHSY